MKNSQTAYTTVFQQAYPDYEATAALDELRAKDFARLDITGDVYLDYTGGGLYGASQLARHLALLQAATFGNPHSDNPTSLSSTQLMEEARMAVLAFFSASPEEYNVIFTPNATGALRLVGESYPFEPGGRFLQFMDNHNSVNGIREFARRRGAPIRLVKSRYRDLHVEKRTLLAALADHTDAPRLFAYPAQSNFSGVQHSLDWIQLAHQRGWDVLLDAAAFVPTNRLDLSVHKPDFVALSFYKMFGWPTGVGCLIAKRSALASLRRPWFSGGTIWSLSVQGDWHIPAPEYEAFEDGTVSYLNLPAVTMGLDYLRNADIDRIHVRVMCLTDWVLTQMKALHHGNGQQLIAIYGPSTSKDRGATIAFNVLDLKGRIIDERVISREAKKWHISLRAGCFCNPGSNEIAFRVSQKALRAGRGDGSRQDLDTYLSSLGLQSGGAIRVSFGIASNCNDAEALLTFLRSFQNASLDNSGLSPRGHC